MRIAISLQHRSVVLVSAGGIEVSQCQTIAKAIAESVEGFVLSQVREYVLLEKDGLEIEDLTLTIKKFCPRTLHDGAR
jgi:hypothetical protein